MVRRSTLPLQQEQQTHILVTNDDGVQAPGLLALAQALREVGEVTVVAPRDNQSATGHRLTFHKPLRVAEARLADGFPALATNGSPADCVALAMLGLLDRKVDVVVSGINDQWNVGQDVTYSGTVTAAMEGALYALPALAISTYSEGEPRYAMAGAIAARLTVEAVRRGLPRHTLLNVNVPDLPQEKIAGVQVTRQGTRIYRDELVERKDPHGRPYYWFGGPEPLGVEDEEGTDFWALARGYVSVTPLNLDMTAHAFVDALQGWELSVRP